MFLCQRSLELETAMKVLFYPHSLQLLIQWYWACFCRINIGSKTSIPGSQELSVMMGNGSIPLIQSRERHIRWALAASICFSYTLWIQCYKGYFTYVQWGFRKLCDLTYLELLARFWGLCFSLKLGCHNLSNPISGRSIKWSCHEHVSPNTAQEWPSQPKATADSLPWPVTFLKEKVLVWEWEDKRLISLSKFYCFRGLGMVTLPLCASVTSLFM